MSYHWTLEVAEIAEQVQHSDSIEIAACVNVGDDIERTTDGPADFYSVYLQSDPKWHDDPSGNEGAFCIADRDTLDEARAFAAELAARWSLPINDFA